MAKKPKSRTKSVLWLLAIGTAVACIWYFEVGAVLQKHLREFLVWVKGLGPWGPAIFIIVYILCCVFFIPGSVVTLGGGAVFGVIAGTIYVSLASITGAALAFLIGRHFLREWVAARIEGNQRFKAIDDAVAEEGWKIVFLTRLTPVFPFNLLNYAFGLTKVSFKGYFFASWIGMVPGTVMYVYLGSLVQDVAAVGLEDQSQTAQAQILKFVGLAATIAITVYVTMIARKALAKRVA